MIPELLDGLLRLARLSVSDEEAPAWAGHAYADAGYRPPRVPFVSVLGPTAFGVEPDRDPARPATALYLSPGHLLGQPRTAADVLPAAGLLRLLLDHDTRVRVDLAGLPAGPLNAGGRGPAMAARVEEAFVNETYVVEAAPGPLTPERLSELRAVTCRWDAANQRFALASGRRGVAAGQAALSAQQAEEQQRPPGQPLAEDTPLPGSAIQVLDGGLAEVLGLANPQEAHVGRLRRHALTAPRAVAVDVRLDLWAGQQRSLGQMVDALARQLPTRGHVITHAAVLATPITNGDRRVRLLSPAQPTRAEDLAHLERVDGFVDRADALTWTGPAAALGGPVMRLTGQQAPERLIHPTPLIPDPRRPAHPASKGWALSVGFAFEGPLNPGQRWTVAQLTHEGAPCLLIEVEIEAVEARVRASADLLTGGGRATLTTEATLPTARLTAGLAVHLSLSAVHRRLRLALDGEPAAEARRADGVLPGGSDMILSVGRAAAPGNPGPMALDHLALSARPGGPLDPQLRASSRSAQQWPIGARLALSPSADGLTPGTEAVTATVVDIDGDELVLDRPISRDLAPGGTLVFSQAWFLKQKQFRRKDDLLNHLFRFCGDFRVSALLDDEQPLNPAPLVRRPRVRVSPDPDQSRGASGLTPGVLARAIGEPLIQSRARGETDRREE